MAMFMLMELSDFIAVTTVHTVGIDLIFPITLLSMERTSEYRFTA